MTRRDLLLRLRQPQRLPGAQGDPGDRAAHRRDGSSTCRPCSAASSRPPATARRPRPSPASRPSCAYEGKETRALREAARHHRLRPQPALPGQHAADHARRGGGAAARRSSRPTSRRSTARCGWTALKMDDPAVIATALTAAGLPAAELMALTGDPAVKARADRQHRGRRRARRLRQPELPGRRRALLRQGPPARRRGGDRGAIPRAPRSGCLRRSANLAVRGPQRSPCASHRRIRSRRIFQREDRHYGRRNSQSERHAEGQGRHRHRRQPRHRRGDRRAARAGGRQGGGLRAHRRRAARAGSPARSPRPSSASTRPAARPASSRPTSRRCGDRERLVETTVAAYGPVDILVNNAAITYFIPVVDFPEKRFKLMMEVQVYRAVPPRAAGAAVDEGAPHRLDREHLVRRRPSIRSRPTRRRPARGGTVYGMCKAALERFTTGLAAEVDGDGVAVNVVSPGLVETPGTLVHNLVNDATRRPGAADRVHRRGGLPAGLGRPRDADRPHRLRRAVPEGDWRSSRRR